MPARRALLPAYRLALSTLLFVACSAGGSGSMTSAPPMAAPKGAPVRFVPADSTKALSGADTARAASCVSPLKDPRTGTIIILVRSENGVGDYLAPSGSYGVPDGQLLRLDCGSGEVLGLVRR
jgi:hypothetical protein